MLLYGSAPRQDASRAPTFAGQQGAQRRFIEATGDFEDFTLSSILEDNARAEAYERRNRAIFEATGVQLDNPTRWDRAGFDAWRQRRDITAQEYRRRTGDGAARDYRAYLERKWLFDARKLAAERPEHAGVIAPDRPMLDDAMAVTRDAETEMAAADSAAAAAGLSGAQRFQLGLKASIAGMLRDPLQVATFALGGGFSAPARSVTFRLVQSMLTEAAINGGVEAGLQAASHEWRKTAGASAGVGHSLREVGIAALFGGGFGGLLAGARELGALLGRNVPEEPLSRIAAGEPRPGDAAAIADALGNPLAPEQARVADIAAEQAELDRIAFGAPPADLDPAQAEQLAAAALRAAEDPDTLPPAPPAARERFDRIDRIVDMALPAGKTPRRPRTLLQFLAGPDVGGLVDDGGELAAMDLSRHFVQGAGAMSHGKNVLLPDGSSKFIPPRFVGGAGMPLVRKSGKKLDMARETVAEAGFMDELYGTPDEALSRSSVEDLLQLVARDRRGEHVFSMRQDGEAVEAWRAYERLQQSRQQLRDMVGEADSAAEALGLPALPDAVLLRSAELMARDGDDAATALERALDQDYRSLSDAAAARGEEGHDDSDIPFFEVGQDARAGANAGGQAGEPRAGGSDAGDGGAAAPDGGRLPGAGGDEGPPPLRPAGATPEPASPEAGEIASLSLTEARGPDAAPEAGAGVTDVWDALPAGRDAEGNFVHVTHADLAAEADRDGLMADLIKSCKD